MAVKANTSPAVCSKDSTDKIGRVLVLGLGNVLLKDEGIGVHIAVELQKQNLPANVEVIDGGTAGMDVLLSQAGLDKLVVVDAIRFGKKAGTIYKLRFKGEKKNKLTRVFAPDSRAEISLHQIGLIDALAAAEKLNCLPKEIVIIGVEPEEISHGLELTQQVKQKIPKIVNAVLEEIKDAVHTR
jgi:hydrogenase maturation protease